MRVKIYWSYYEFNTVTKTVTRLKPGNGTRPGKVLKPYNGNTVKLSVKNRQYQLTLEQLTKRY